MDAVPTCDLIRHSTGKQQTTVYNTISTFTEKITQIHSTKSEIWKYSHTKTGTANAILPTSSSVCIIFFIRDCKKGKNENMTTGLEINKTCQVRYSHECTQFNLSKCLKGVI